MARDSVQAPNPPERVHPHQGTVADIGVLGFARETQWVLARKAPSGRRQLAEPVEQEAGTVILSAGEGQIGRRRPTYPRRDPVRLVLILRHDRSTSIRERIR